MPSEYNSEPYSSNIHCSVSSINHTGKPMIRADDMRHSDVV